jgi:hypothetical protein
LASKSSDADKKAVQPNQKKLRAYFDSQSK